MLTFEGVHGQIMNDTTPEIAVVGGRGSGKSTTCVTKEIRYSKKYPGIIEFLFRFSEKDTESKLIPFFKEMCIHEGACPVWNDKESCFVFPVSDATDARSRTYMFGLRATSAAQRFSKLRGLGAARAMSDQSEELSRDIASELRLSIRQPGFPKQVTFGGQPPDLHHWLPKEFPVGVETKFKNRHLYQLSLYDNPYFPADSLKEIEQAYPPDHPNYKTLILGQYGTSVSGEAIYGKLFNRKLHVWPMTYDPRTPLLECFDFGKLSPCWVVAQRPYTGGLRLLGGLIGLDLFLEDFIPVVQQYREQWFPQLRADDVKTCCTLSISRDDGNKLTSVQQLRAVGFKPRWVEGSNSPDTVLALIEAQANYLRRRGADGREMLGINEADDHWLRVSNEGIEPSAFMTYAYEGGYSWRQKDDGKPLTVSVGRNEVLQPTADEWFEFPMRCVEAIELNFGTPRPTDEERHARGRGKRTRWLQYGQGSMNWTG